MTTESADIDPWDWMQPHDLERFGQQISDPQERKRWCTATLIGGLPYMWRMQAAAMKNFMYSQMNIRPGNRVLILGESVESCGFREEIQSMVGKEGHVDVIDIIEEARNATGADKRGVSGKRGTWRYAYTEKMEDNRYDCIGVLQAVQHSDDWRQSGQDLLRVTKRGGILMLAEITFGPRLRQLASQDLHLQYWVDKLSHGAGVPNLEVAYYSADELRHAFDGLLDKAQAFEWRGLELFWGSKP
jgi:ubiquinone/menaquinone biosynthesis C-methylase UbiE